MINLPLFAQAEPVVGQSVIDNNNSTNPLESIVIPDGQLFYHPECIPHREGQEILAEIIADTPWEQSRLRIGGRECPIPRLNAWYGDKGAYYGYSGTRLKLNPWTRRLTELKRQVERLSGERFNSALLNYYRSGDDSVDWHSDDEAGLGSNPAIASLSLGVERRFDLRHKTRNTLRYKLDLAHGSLLVMAGTLQHHWQHRIAKSRGLGKPRVNITFRQIKT